MALHEQAVQMARQQGSKLRAQHDGTATTAWQLKENREHWRGQRQQAALVRQAKERAAAVAEAALAEGRDVRLDEPGGKAWQLRQEKARAGRWAAAKEDLEAHMQRVEDLAEDRRQHGGAMTSPPPSLRILGTHPTAQILRATTADQFVCD